MKGANKSPLSVFVVALALCFLLAAFTSDAVLLEKKAAETVMMEEEELLISSNDKLGMGCPRTLCYPNCIDAGGSVECCGASCGCFLTPNEKIKCPPKNVLCYRRCRATSKSKLFCACRCGCSVVTNEEEEEETGTRAELLATNA